MVILSSSESTYLRYRRLRDAYLVRQGTDGRAKRAGEPEVSELELPVPADEKILRFKVAEVKETTKKNTHTSKHTQRQTKRYGLLHTTLLGIC